MNKYIIIIGIIILIIAALLVSSYINNVNIKKRIRSRWGQPPIKNRNDNIESISAYWIRKLKHQPSDYYIDDITWNDLSMNEVFNRLNSTNSSVGSEYLYAMLHELNKGLYNYRFKCIREVHICKSCCNQLHFCPNNTYMPVIKLQLQTVHGRNIHGCSR